MYGFLIAMTVGVLTGLGLSFGGVCGIGWSIGLGVVAFVVAQVVLGRIIQKRVKEAMDAVQGVLLEGQKRLQAKMARWQMRPPGSIQAAQAEIARDQKVFVREALEQTEVLHKFDNWVPMMKRQIATAQFQLHWMIKDFKKVDELMPKALFLDPTTNAMKLARMYMTDQPVEEMAKVYEKATRRLRLELDPHPEEGRGRRVQGAQRRAREERQRDAQGEPRPSREQPRGALLQHGARRPVVRPAPRGAPRPPAADASAVAVASHVSDGACAAS